MTLVDRSIREFGLDVGRGWFPADAESHRRDAPKFCPSCAAPLGLAEGGHGLATEYWVGGDRVFVCYCASLRVERRHRADPAGLGHEAPRSRPYGRDVVDELGAVEVGVEPAGGSSCAWVPHWTIRPPSTTRIWSALRTVESRWAITSEVRPSSAASRARCTAASDSESRWAVASSSTTIAGALSSSRAIASRWRSPPESR